MMTRMATPAVSSWAAAMRQAVPISPVDPFAPARRPHPRQFVKRHPRQHPGGGGADGQEYDAATTVRAHGAGASKLHLRRLRPRRQDDAGGKARQGGGRQLLADQRGVERRQQFVGHAADADGRQPRAVEARRQSARLGGVWGGAEVIAEVHGVFGFRLCFRRLRGRGARR